LKVYLTEVADPRLDRESAHGRVRGGQGSATGVEVDREDGSVLGQRQRVTTGATAEVGDAARALEARRGVARHRRTGRLLGGLAVEEEAMGVLELRGSGAASFGEGDAPADLVSEVELRE